MPHRSLPLLLVAAALCAACTRAPEGDAAHGYGPWDDSALVEAARLQSRTMADREPGSLSIVVGEPVVGFTGPGGEPFEVAVRSGEPATGHTRRFGTTTLPTSLRGTTPVLGQYPCTSCHFGRRVVMVDDRIDDAHKNIQPVHPDRVGAVCSTCHAPENVETLALRGGERPTLDHAYRLCAQCHFTQADAWAAGAHGKRLDGWQGRRVVMTCTDCHDPHRPQTATRVPFRAPQLERTGRDH